LGNRPMWGTREPEKKKRRKVVERKKTFAVHEGKRTLAVGEKKKSRWPDSKHDPNSWNTLPKGKK